MNDVTLTLTPVEADLVRETVEKRRAEVQKRVIDNPKSGGSSRRYAMHEVCVCDGLLAKLPVVGAGEEVG